MNIAQHILDVLQTNNTVTVGTLGTFEATNTNAQIDTTEQTISAPILKITFSEKLKNESAIFHSYLTQKERVTEAEANFYINQFCKNIINNTNSKGEYKIPFFGQFNKATPTSAIEFVQDAAYLQGQVIGLKPLAAVNAISGTKVKIGEKLVDNSAKKIEFTTPTRKKTKNNNNLLLAIFGLIALATTLFILWWCYTKFGNKPANNVDTLVTPPIQTPTTPVANNITDTSNTATTTTLATPITNTNQFVIIFKSDALKADAEKSYLKFQKWGKTNVTIQTTDSLKYTVGFAYTAPLADTSLYLDTIRRMYNPKAYVKQN